MFWNYWQNWTLSRPDLIVPQEYCWWNSVVSDTDRFYKKFDCIDMVFSKWYFDGTSLANFNNFHFTHHLMKFKSQFRRKFIRKLFFSWIFWTGGKSKLCYRNHGFWAYAKSAKPLAWQWNDNSSCRVWSKPFDFYLFLFSVELSTN